MELIAGGRGRSSSPRRGSFDDRQHHRLLLFLSVFGIGGSHGVDDIVVGVETSVSGRQRESTSRHSGELLRMTMQQTGVVNAAGWSRKVRFRVVGRDGGLAVDRCEEKEFLG